MLLLKLSQQPELELNPDLSHGWQGSIHLNHYLLPSMEHVSWIKKWTET